jgi:hypothetical protein
MGRESNKGRWGEQERVVLRERESEGGEMGERESGGGGEKGREGVRERAR